MTAAEPTLAFDSSIIGNLNEVDAMGRVHCSEDLGMRSDKNGRGGSPWPWISWPAGESRLLITAGFSLLASYNRLLRGLHFAGGADFAQHLPC